MNPRALYLIGVLLVSPAWSQEIPANAPAISPRSFDLSHHAIKKIVRDTATSLSVAVTVSEESVPRRESLETLRFPPPEKAPPDHKVLLPAPTPPSSGPIGSLIDVLLGFDDDVPAVRHDRNLACRWPDKMRPPAPGRESCPAVSRDPLRMPMDLPVYEFPTTR